MSPTRGAFCVPHRIEEANSRALPSISNALSQPIVGKNRTAAQPVENLVGWFKITQPVCLL